MKLAKPLSRGLLSYLPSVFAMSLGVVGIGLHGQVDAEAVDRELVLLADDNQAGLSQRPFSTLMDAYVASFTSSKVLNSIQSGTTGPIAVSLKFNTTNVAGSGLAGVGPSVAISSFNATVETNLVTSLADNVGDAVAAHPEPNASLGVLSGIGFLLIRRRRA